MHDSCLVESGKTAQQLQRYRFHHLQRESLQPMLDERAEVSSPEISREGNAATIRIDGIKAGDVWMAYCPQRFNLLGYALREPLIRSLHTDEFDGFEPSSREMYCFVNFAERSTPDARKEVALVFRHYKEKRFG